MDKLDELTDVLRGCGSMVVAFSGGTDSTLLAAAAGRAGARVLLATATSPLLPPRELEHAEAVARRLGLEHRVVEAGEWYVEEVRGNAPDRCYYCKKKRLTTLQELARSQGYDTVVEGSQADDLGRHRPGMRAARELGIRSPLLQAGLGQADIHAALDELGLGEFIQPSRSCLATRFPYGTMLDAEEMRRIDGVEEWLEEKGMGQARARRPEPHCLRIEVGLSDIARLASEPLRSELLEYCKEKGFARVWLDLRGYNGGGMDEPSGLKEETLL